MARLKTIKIDDRTREIRDDANIIDVVPSEVTSITTRDGKLIPRSEFARVRVPEGFETNLSAINKGACRHMSRVAAPVASAAARAWGWF